MHTPLTKQNTALLGSLESDFTVLNLTLELFKPLPHFLLFFTDEWLFRI